MSYKVIFGFCLLYFRHLPNSYNMSGNLTKGGRNWVKNCL
nr:MAG TPA: hypothetical protein [Bacteriophage sp.]